MKRIFDILSALLGIFVLSPVLIITAILADDLRREFPDMKGFSSRNLKYMRLFAETWSNEQFVQRVVAQIPLDVRLSFWG
ncbi:MAG: hypothetical protein A2X80_09120 [Geobacteraceae bacterium GWB2_52_12]|nr:MAG: hypothetical protein A2X80_09120 [Geobacteraceae bacterium GWB2_52_12]